MEKDYVELAVVGCGPAGLSAAINAKIRKKDVQIFGLELCSPKLHAAPQVDNYLGFPNISGSKLRENFLEHLHYMGLSVVTQKVDAIYKDGEGFIVQGGADFVRAGAVILATGVSSKNLFPGEEELLGRGVGYCATCDGQLYSDKKVAVISYIKEGEDEVSLLAKYCREVIFIPLYAGYFVDVDTPGNVTIITSDIPLRIEGRGKVEALIMENKKLKVDGVFILRASIPPEKLIPEITMESSAIKVTKKNQTNIPGIFAAGDCTGTPYQLAKSVGEGQVAALSAVKYIDTLKHKGHKASVAT